MKLEWSLLRARIVPPEDIELLLPAKMIGSKPIIASCAQWEDIPTRLVSVNRITPCHSKCFASHVRQDSSNPMKDLQSVKNVSLENI